MRKSIMSSIFVLFTVSLSFACASKTGNPASDNTNSDTTNDQETTSPSGESGLTDAGSNNSPPTNNTNVGDSGTNDANTGALPKEPTNQAECIQVCETNHPNAAQLTTEFSNTCMLFGGKCDTVCNNLAHGENKYYNGNACDTNAANSFPIGTPSQACSDCIGETTECCNLWIGIFGSDEGKSLNKCANACWTKFPN